MTVLEMIPAGNLCHGGLKVQLQCMLSEVLPTGGMPAGLHVDQDYLMEGDELYSLLLGGGITGGPWVYVCVLGFRFQGAVVLMQYQSLPLPPGKVLPICVTQ